MFPLAKRLPFAPRPHEVTLLGDNKKSWTTVYKVKALRGYGAGKFASSIKSKVRRG